MHAARKNPGPGTGWSGDALIDGLIVDSMAGGSRHSDSTEDNECKRGCYTSASGSANEEKERPSPSGGTKKYFRAGLVLEGQGEPLGARGHILMYTETPIEAVTYSSERL